jgi:hypothetical protein
MLIHVAPQSGLAPSYAHGIRSVARWVDSPLLTVDVPNPCAVALRDVVRAGAAVVASVRFTIEQSEEQPEEKADQDTDSERAPPPHAGTFGVLAARLDVWNSRSISVW